MTAPHIRSMPPTFDTLPEELEALIIKQIPTNALKQLSLVSHKWHKLVHLELFSALTLDDRSAAEIEEMYSELFKASNAVGCVSLTGKHVRTIDYSFTECDLDEEELRSKTTAVAQILDALQSVSVLEVRLSLSDEASVTFEEILLPVMESFFATARDKVKAIEITIDIGASMAFLEGLDDMDLEMGNQEPLTQKVSQFCDIIPPSLVTSLFFVETELASIPPSLGRILQSSSLKELSLQDCNESFISMPQIPNLEDLSISWSGEEQGDSAMGALFQSLSGSASTLKTLSLQAVLSTDVPLSGAGWSTVPSLPSLTRLQVADSHLGTGSLFDAVFSRSSLPKLSSLTLEVEDILASASYINARPNLFGGLRFLKLVEGGGKREPQGEVLYTAAYSRLQEICQQSDVDLEVSVSTRCSTPLELTQEAKRLEVFAANLTCIALNCNCEAQPGIHNLPHMHFPNVQRLLVGYCGSLTPRPTEKPELEVGMAPPALKSLFEHFECPKLTSLKLTVFIDDESATANLAELEGIIKEGIYPCLERLAGAVMSAPGMSAQAFEALEDAITTACEQRHVDCTSLSFMSRGELGYNEEEDEDLSANGGEHSLDGAEDADSVNLTYDNDREDGSESGESGYAEETSTLSQCLDKASSDSDSDDPDYVPGDTSSGSSGTSEDSWLTDEDEILEAFTRPAGQ